MRRLVLFLRVLGGYIILGILARGIQLGAKELLAFNVSSTPCKGVAHQGPQGNRMIIISLQALIEDYGVIMKRLFPSRDR